MSRRATPPFFGAVLPAEHPGRTPPAGTLTSRRMPALALGDVLLQARQSPAKRIPAFSATRHSPTPTPAGGAAASLHLQPLERPDPTRGRRANPLRWTNVRLVRWTGQREVGCEKQRVRPRKPLCIKP